MFNLFKKKKVEQLKPEVKCPDNGVEINCQILDTIELLPYIERFKRKDLTELIHAIEDDYNNTELTNNEYLEGYIFNWLTVEEIIDYFQKRYPKEFKVIAYYNYELV